MIELSKRNLFHLNDDYLVPIPNNEKRFVRNSHLPHLLGMFLIQHELFLDKCVRRFKTLFSNLTDDSMTCMPPPMTSSTNSKMANQRENL